MSRFATQLAMVCHALHGEGAQYVLVGDRALQLWGSAVPTRDLVILIAPTAANAAAVLRALHMAGVALAKEWLAGEIAARAATILGADPCVHLLTSVPGIPYEVAASEARTLRLEGVPIPTASLDHLIAMHQIECDQADDRLVLLEAVRRNP